MNPLVVFQAPNRPDGPHKHEQCPQVWEPVRKALIGMIRIVQPENDRQDTDHANETNETLKRPDRQAFWNDQC